MKTPDWFDKKAPKSTKTTRPKVSPNVRFQAARNEGSRGVTKRRQGKK